MPIDPETALAAIVSAAAALPTIVKSSFAKAMGRLITGTVDVPAAWLEGKAQALRDDAAARSLITRQAAEAAAAQFKTDPALVERAVNHFGARLLKEQANREYVAAAAAQDLAANPPTEDSKTEISEDWLDMFSRFAETRSDEDVKLYFGKLLAEEIRKPGSFSPATMQVLASMTPSTAELFQRVCAVCVTFEAVRQPPTIYCQPFGSPGSNSLSPFGLSYTNLSLLQAAGLLHGDLNAWRELPPFVFFQGVLVAKRPIPPIPFPAQPPSEDVLARIQKMERVGVVNLTPAGLELNRIVHAEPNQEYVEGLLAWATSKLPALSSPPGSP